MHPKRDQFVIVSLLHLGNPKTLVNDPQKFLMSVNLTLIILLDNVCTYAQTPVTCIRKSQWQLTKA